ncbi:MAG: hypothetical protein J7L23_00540 [Candidatus Diapherotrites archaeon]|nr:hypothetical protein [Candidatus Diapherotrites archaeon]
MPEKEVSKMNFDEFEEHIKKLSPGKRGFKKRAFNHFDELFEKKFGFKDSEHRKKVIHQILDRLNVGDSLYTAMNETAVVPLSLKEKELKYYGNIERDWVGEHIERIRFSKDGIVKYPRESLREAYTPAELKKQIKAYLDTSAGPEHGYHIEDTMAKALASLACEGITTSFDELKHYLNVPGVPQESRKKIEKWLETSRYHREAESLRGRREARSHSRGSRQ